jgi:hypothetical protein
MAAEPTATGTEAAPATPAPLRVAASTTPVRGGGKANLTTSVFVPKGDTYVGTYGIKVTPYFFKNETGSLLIKLRPEALRQLRKGSAITFDGRAVTAGTGENHTVLLHAVALNEKEGKLTITINSVNGGKVVFDTTYRFEA